VPVGPANAKSWSCTMIRFAVVNGGQSIFAMGAKVYD